MLSALAKGLALGIGAAAPIGPVNVEIARRVLRGGFRRGFALGCGAVTVDVTYAVLTSLGLIRLLDRSGIRITLSALGAALLAFLGVMSIRAARAVLKPDALNLASESAPSVHGSYVTGLLMTFFNPMTIAFWLFAVPATMGSDTAAAEHLPLTCFGVFLATLAWVAGFCSVLSLIGKRANRIWFAAADVAGGIVLLVFAGLGICRLVRELA